MEDKKESSGCSTVIFLIIFMVLPIVLSDLIFEDKEAAYRSLIINGVFWGVVGVFLFMYKRHPDDN